MIDDFVMLDLSQPFSQEFFLLNNNSYSMIPNND